MALNVPEDLAMVIAEAIENSETSMKRALTDEEAEAIYDLADTIRGAIHNAPEGTDAAITFTA